MNESEGKQEEKIGESAEDIIEESLRLGDHGDKSECDSARVYDAPEYSRNNKITSANGMGLSDHPLTRPNDNTTSLTDPNREHPLKEKKEIFRNPQPRSRVYGAGIPINFFDNDDDDEDAADEEHHDALGPLSSEILTPSVDDDDDDEQHKKERSISAPRRSVTHEVSTRIPRMTDEAGVKEMRQKLARLRSEAGSKPTNATERFIKSLRKKFCRWPCFNWCKSNTERQLEIVERKTREQKMAEASAMNLSLRGRLIVSSRDADLDHSHRSASKKHRSLGSHIRKRSVSIDDSSDEDDDDDIEGGSSRPKTPQYRLQAIKPESNCTKFLKSIGLARSSIYDELDDRGKSRWNFNVMVVKYFFWTFRSSFVSVALSAMFSFVVLTMIFASLIYGIARHTPKCLGGVPPTKVFFTDAYMLSWTTFATVGFGVVYPGLPMSQGEIKDCMLITIVTSTESFIGVLYGSMCLAVLFAKLSRIQSFAQVMFSDPIVIRYGTGVTMEENGGAAEGDDPDDDSANDSNIPCPILEFRLVNRLHSTVGGEIIDSTLNIVASIDATQYSPSAANQNRRRGKKGKKTRRTPTSLRGRHRTSIDGNASKACDDEKQEALAKLFESVPSTFTRKSRHKTCSFDLDSDGNLTPTLVYSKLEIESPDHPFFKRVWMVRHTLDQNSPLLKPPARQLVTANNGHWPKELNSAEGVRAAVAFDQILVSFSGTSNADANSVYAQKVYDFVDVNVGYCFVNILYRDEVDGTLHVDARLLNDVLEQAGGGGEPLDLPDYEEEDDETDI